MHAITVLTSYMSTGFIHDEKGITGRRYLSSSETEFGVVETGCDSEQHESAVLTVVLTIGKVKVPEKMLRSDQFSRI